MSRTLCLVSAATIGFVLCSAGRTAEAAPVMLGMDAYDQLATAIAPIEQSGSAAAEEKPAHVTHQLPEQDGMLPAGSLGGTSSTTVTAGAASGTALTVPALSYEPPLLRLYLLPDRWVFIPPRFLDGIFRPPRSLVSL